MKGRGSPPEGLEEEVVSVLRPAEGWEIVEVGHRGRIGNCFHSPRLVEVLWLLELHSLQLVESRSVSCSYQRPTWRGTSGASGILPGRPSTCYRTSPGARYRWHHLYTELHS